MRQEELGLAAHCLIKLRVYRCTCDLKIADTLLMIISLCGRRRVASGMRRCERRSCGSRKPRKRSGASSSRRRRWSWRPCGEPPDPCDFLSSSDTQRL